MEAMKHHRRSKTSVARLIVFKVLPTIVLVPIAIGIIGLGHWLAGGFLIAVTVFVYFAHYVDFWIAKRRHRRSPFCGDTICFHFSCERVSMTAEKSNSDSKWEVFTGGLIFGDGVLLFQGPVLFNWLPFRCLDDPQQQNALLELVRAKLGSRVNNR